MPLGSALRRLLLAAALVAGAFGAVAAPSVADDVVMPVTKPRLDPPPKKDCFANGSRYSHGSIAILPTSDVGPQVFTCNNGRWIIGAAGT